MGILILLVCVGMSAAKTLLVEVKDEDTPPNKTDGASCTRYGLVVQHGERLFDGCNWCYCNPGGMLCTERGCPDLKGNVCDDKGIKRRLGWSGTCSDGCNLCKCTHDAHLVHTDKKCPGAPCKSGNKTYQHGEGYYNDRNWCTCINGTSDCTKKLCPKRAPGKSGNKTYQHGEGYYNDCNWCTCINGTSGCTKKLCPKKCKKYGPPCPTGMVCNTNDGLCSYFKKIDGIGSLYVDGKKVFRN